MRLRALIVDDEPFVRADLRQLLAAHADVSVEGEAGTVAECERLLASASADVLFLDIQLRGGSGFDVVPLVRPGTEIVFVTAFDRYAVRAFEVNALDFLVKPVAPERLRVALDRLRARRGERPERDEPPPGRFESTDRILLKTDKARRFVSVRDIASVTSLGGNYTEVHLLHEAERPAVRKTLKEWAELLPEADFVRVHRHAIVGVRAIARIGRDESGQTSVWLTDSSTSFEVSRRCVAELARALERRG